MADGTWRTRLREKLNESGKSDSAVSVAAGCSRGYLNGILVGGKEPTVDKLIAICEAIPASFIYVTLGVDAAPEDVRVLKALQESPEKRRAILALLGAASA